LAKKYNVSNKKMKNERKIGPTGLKNGGGAGHIMTVRLAILSRGPRLYSTRRLLEEAEKQDCYVEILDPMRLSITVGNEEPRILNAGWPVEVDAVIPRIGYSITHHGVALIRQFERLGVYVANSSEGISHSRDKLHATQLLTKNRIPVPTTCHVRTWQDVEGALSKVGGMPVVVKVSEGTQGSGVFLVHTEDRARELTYKLLSEGHHVLVQEYIEESHGRDIRVIVVGGKVVAAMRRRARGREFRSNFHLNGTVENIDLADEYADVARRAARLLNLDVAGVDLLESDRGPLVLEVNSSPGLEGIEGATGVNVAGAIIEHCIIHQGFSNVGLDQLLRSRPGHGVVSLNISRHPILSGKQIGDVFTSVNEQFVFAVAREGMHIWKPRRTFLLRRGDEIICYGEIDKIHQQLAPWVSHSIDNNNVSPSTIEFSEESY
jgi:ribosomal protein S6--L-glutamate ligase